jgi:hypothetical protein
MTRKLLGMLLVCLLARLSLVFMFGVEEQPLFGLLITCTPFPNLMKKKNLLLEMLC